MEGAILGSRERYGNPAVVLLSGGVGGARMARALRAVLPATSLTVIVNVGDDDVIYGVPVSPDVDTVVYTLAGIEGPEGWGIAGDTFTMLERLGDLGVDTTFRLGDRDLAHCLFRAGVLAGGGTLSAATAALSTRLGADTEVVPATDDPLRTRVRTAGGEWLDFQEYFVWRGHRDDVVDLAFDGAGAARPPDGICSAIATADLVVIAPSNPPLSIWPILAIDGIAATVAAHERVVAVSPLFGGSALKGPAARVMAGLGLPPGNTGVAIAYQGVITDLVVDTGDADDAVPLADRGLRIHVADTRIGEPAAGRAFASWLLDRMLP